MIELKDVISAMAGIAAFEHVVNKGGNDHLLDLISRKDIEVIKKCVGSALAEKADVPKELWINPETRGYSKTNRGGNRFKYIRDDSDLFSGNILGGADD
jgi:hypothetical protein